MPTADVSRCSKNHYSISSSAHKQDRGRQLDADLLRRAQIDHQLEFRRLLDWQLGRVCAFEYLVDVSCCAPPHVDLIWTITHQPAGLSDEAKFGHQGQALLLGKFDDACALGLDERVVHRGKSLGVRFLYGSEASLELAGIAHRERLYRQSQGRSRELHLLELQAVAGRVGIPEHGDAKEVRQKFLQQLESLGALFGC